ncbi:MAG TPA: hypothetical protein VK812_09260, partial [Candidatus Binatus sp.]|nr:hypothetical protein [Candidatus Binatus sp.]
FSLEILRFAQDFGARLRRRANTSTLPSSPEDFANRPLKPPPERPAFFVWDFQSLSSQYPAYGQMSHGQQ